MLAIFLRSNKVSFFEYFQFLMRLIRLGKVADLSPTDARIQYFFCGRMYIQARFCTEFLKIFLGQHFGNFDMVQEKPHFLLLHSLQ